ncbi:hypothetical protein RHRU231_330102 [Rhodococcus ruber]|uniref:Uncharacterized protein n=1 Tax=Rhodococcus ruber TaxID=1830 RepID=A0A098BHD1_9NOCA|nr:hypothetical protein RHRU231_330102 [Rhodococcus ruber]
MSHPPRDKRPATHAERPALRGGYPFGGESTPRPLGRRGERFRVRRFRPRRRGHNGRGCSVVRMRAGQGAPG